jgi:hypothetical protein
MATTNTTHTKTSMTVAATHTIDPKRYCANACWTPHSRARRLLRTVLTTYAITVSGKVTRPPPSMKLNTIKYWTRVAKGAKAGMIQTGGSPIERVLEHRTPAAVQRRDGKTKNTNRT